jgi:hypothetical protein
MPELSRRRAAGVVRGGSPVLGAVVFGLFAAFWLGLMTIVTALGWGNIRRQTPALVMTGIFWAAGIFLATMAGIAILRALRFGASTLTLDVTPARLGGWLSGVIQGPQAVGGAELQLAVECVRTWQRQRDSSTPWVYWRTTKVLDGALCERRAGQVEIPFAIRLPEKVEATEPGDGMTSLFGPDVAVDAADVDWYVSVKARLPGVDYENRFAVPVGAPEPGAPLVPDRPPREMPELSAERLGERLPGRVEHQLDADVLLFPLKPSLILWPVGLAAVATAGILFGDAPLLAGLPRGVLEWTPIVCGTLAALSLLGLLLDPRRVEVAPDAVRIRRGLLGVGVHRTIPREEVAAVEEATSRSDPPIYLVKLRLRNGKSFGVAPTLHRPDRAAALAARLREILRVR